MPELHIVQPSHCCPIAKEFDRDIPDVGVRLADAIVDIVARRKNSVSEFVRQSQGFGWVVSNDEIQKAMMVAKTGSGVELSPNGALALAGMMKARRHKWNWKGVVVCIIGGK